VKVQARNRTVLAWLLFASIFACLAAALVVAVAVVRPLTMAVLAGGALGVTLPLLLLPDGRLRSPRWRLAVWASLAGALLMEVGGSVAPGQLADRPIDNPLGLSWGSAEPPARSPTS
jgi:hypothetical protein